MLAPPGNAVQGSCEEGTKNKSPIAEEGITLGEDQHHSLQPQHRTTTDLRSSETTPRPGSVDHLSCTPDNELSTVVRLSAYYPAEFNKSPEPIPDMSSHEPQGCSGHGATSQHQYHLLNQIREDHVSGLEKEVTLSPNARLEDPSNARTSFRPHYAVSRMVYQISERLFQHEEYAAATWIGFWGLLSVTCANYVLTPMRDAVALQVGVQHIPKLTLASSVLAFLSSVPIGWLFEAPDPKRRKLWKAMGLTRGETQGTSLALFYRCFALSVLSYALGFKVVDWINRNPSSWSSRVFAHFDEWEHNPGDSFNVVPSILKSIHVFLGQLGHVMYVAFFLVVHLMKLHSLSLVWGVTAEAMEYEDVARQKSRENKNNKSCGNFQNGSLSQLDKSKSRLQRLALVGFGGTLGGILGR